MADIPGGGSRQGQPQVTRRLEGKGLEARTKAVEEALGPLIMQVTELSHDNRLQTRSGKPPKLEKLVQIVEQATKKLVSVGEQIASENAGFQEDLLLACDEVKSAGDTMHQAAVEFSQDTLDSERRETMVVAARVLLMAVTRLMVVVDAVDVQRMFRTSNRMEVKLQALYSVSSEAQLMRTIRNCTPDITRLTQLAEQRLKEVKNEVSQQLLAAAQTQLNQASRSLITSSKTFLQYPHMASAQANRNYTISNMVESLGAIAELVDGKDPTTIPFLLTVEDGSCRLFQHFNEFERLLDSITSQGHPINWDQLQRVLQSLLSETGDVLSLSFTHDYRQHSVITLSSALKHKSKKLSRALEMQQEGGKRERGEGEGGRGGGKLENDKVIERMKEVKKTALELKKELTNAIMDQLSGAFLHPLGWMEKVEAAAVAAREVSLRKRLRSFTRHATDMEKAAHLVCSLSQDKYGIRTTRFVVKYISELKPQVACAAQTLCTYPQSHLTQRNMVLFREAWAENVQLLMDSVEALVPLTLFMTVVEVHVREDSQRFMQAVEGGDGREMRKVLRAVRGRTLQLLRMVRESLAGNSEAYGKGQLPGVEDTMQALREKSLPWFTDLGSKAADTLLSTRNPHTVNKSALEEAAQKMNADIWELRRTVLLARGEWEGDVDSELQTPGLGSPFPLSQESALSIGRGVSPNGAKFERTPRYSGVFQNTDNTQAVLAGLSSGQRAQLVRETEILSQEHFKFEKEVSRWSDSGHDIIIIAKEMCSMMLDMSDFTRGQGQLQTAMDVIVTAKDVARAGEYLFFITKPIAEKCPNVQHREDLLAHLDQMRLNTHQLKITSAVRAEHEELTGDVANNTVDTASAMLTAARSLMNTVVLVVKTCYLASSAIARAEGVMPEEVVQWRLESPKKKKLTPERQDHPVKKKDTDLPHSYSEKEHTHSSPRSQLEQFKEEDGKGKERGKRGAAVPSTRGRGNGKPKWKKGRGELEAIPEVASSHDLHDTHF